MGPNKNFGRRSLKARDGVLSEHNPMITTVADLEALPTLLEKNGYSIIESKNWNKQHFMKQIEQYFLGVGVLESHLSVITNKPPHSGFNVSVTQSKTHQSNGQVDRPKHGWRIGSPRSSGSLALPMLSQLRSEPTFDIIFNGDTLQLFYKEKYITDTNQETLLSSLANVRQQRQLCQ